jgi:hypothetical protein
LKMMFKDARDRIVPKYALQVEQQFIFPKGDTVAMKNHVLETCRRAGIRPEYYACDRTGTGSGVADLLKNEWSSIIHDLNYSEGATQAKLMVEDTKTCEELYARVVTELWFALRMWGEFGCVYFHPSMDMSKLTQQLTQRRFKTSAGKAKVESKTDYKSRGYTSPNEADSVTLLVHAARRGSGIIMSMRGNTLLPDGTDSDDDWNDFRYPGGTRVDPSNQSDYLDESNDPNERAMRFITGGHP